MVLYVVSLGSAPVGDAAFYLPVIGCCVPGRHSGLPAMMQELLFVKQKEPFLLRWSKSHARV